MKRKFKKMIVNNSTNINKSLNTKRTMTYANENPSPGLRQAQKCHGNPG